MFQLIFCLSCQNFPAQENLPQAKNVVNIKTEDQHSGIKKAMNNPLNGFRYFVITETPYYIDGPQQGRPQDGTFKKGTKLKLITSAGSYALIESEEGIKAYVAVNDIDKSK